MTHVGQQTQFFLILDRPQPSREHRRVGPGAVCRGCGGRGRLAHEARGKGSASQMTARPSLGRELWEDLRASTTTSTAFPRPRGLHLGPQKKPAAPVETPVRPDPCGLLDITLQPRGSAQPRVVAASALRVPRPTRGHVPRPPVSAGDQV